MNCKGCNYPLWNLTDRRCPECGKGFVPSEFEFIPRAVRFLCPFCKQQYFGTDEHGHLVPRSFACVSCNSRITMDEMILMPAEGVAEHLAVQELNPWLNSTQRGFFNRWLATIGRSMTAPTRLINSTPKGSSGGRAFVFAVINILLSMVLTSAAMVVFYLLMPVGPGGGLAAVGFFAMMLATVIVFPILWLLAWMLCTHGILRILGPLPGGIRATCRCLWYSSGPYVITALPCVGTYLLILPALIWWGVSASIMLSRAHAVSGLRAAIAAFAPVLILLACIVTMIFVPIVGMTRAVGFAAASAASTQSVLQQSRAATMSMALLNYRNINNAYPIHAVELIDSGPASAMDFSLSMDPLGTDMIPIDTMTLSAFELAQPATRQQTIARLQAATPKDVIAHRVGHYVFTYHQLPVDSPDPGLWVFVADQPSPPTSTTVASPGNLPPTMPVYLIGLANGGTTIVPKSVLPSMLQQQNDLRATFNLPPLPEPTTVTNANPAAAPK